MKNFILFFLCILTFLNVNSQINISAGGTISESFTVGTSATATLPTGWKAEKNATVRTVGQFSTAVSNTENRAGDNMGSAAGNGIYNYANGDPTTSTDRAIGFLSSSSATKSGNLFAFLNNNGASTIGSFNISYKVEKYRNGSNTAGFTVQLYYSTDGNNWTSAGANFTTNFPADADNNGFASAPGTTVNVSNQALTIAIATSSSVYLAWNYSVTSGTTTSNAQGIGIDDISISAIASICSAPLTPASTINFTNIALYSMTANWTRGDGSEILVVCKEGSLVDANPVDGTSYTANSIFGSGTQIGTGNYVVYKGTGTSVNLTGLNQNTQYYFQAYEFNCSGIVSKYNITDVVIDNETTLALCTTPIAASSNLTFSNVTSGSMKLTWTSSTSDYRIVIAKKTSAVTAVPSNNTTYTASSTFGLGQQIVANEYVVYVGNGNNVTVTGLDISTTYYYAIYELCAATGNGSEAYFTTPLTGSKITNANIPAKCLEIESILVDACARVWNDPPVDNIDYQEGPNEMVRFRVGPNSININNINVTWPANTWRGLCQNDTTAYITNALNSTILGCGLLIEPPAGIIPPGAKVLMITSSNTLLDGKTYFDLQGNSFEYLSDTLYVIYQCSNSANRGGHFRNYDVVSGIRTLIIRETSVACSDTASYDISLLVNQTGGYGGSTSQKDGSRVDYEWDGTPTYVNNGCQAPYEPVSVVAVNAFGSNDVCFNQTIPITGNVVGAFTNLNWTGGSGTFGNSTELSTTYTTNISEIGNVTLYLNASNACGNVKDSIIITVYNNPSISLSSDTSICMGTSATLNALGGSSYLWSNSATSSSITVSPIINTTYNVTVSNAACSANSSVLVTIMSNPNIDLGADIEACVNDLITLDAGAGYSYNWSTTESSQTINFNTGGNYSVTITDGNNCSDRDTIKVTFHNPSVDLGVNITDCEGTTHTLNAGAGFIYAWSTSESSQTIQINQTGNYYVTITDSYTCQAIDSINLLLYPNPIVNLGNDTAFCSNSSIILDAGNGFTYIWSNTSSQQTLSINNSGIYHVTITDGNNCTGRDTIIITVNQLPSVAHSSTQATCGNADGSATVNPSGGSGSYTYIWGASAGNQTTQTASNLPVGIHNVTINDGNCPVTYNVTVTEIGAPSLTLTISNTTICSGETVNLQISGADSYTWNTGATSSSISIVLNSDSTLSVTGTTSGCSSIESVNIIVNPLPIPSLGNDTSICSGGIFTLNPGSFNSYNWSNSSSSPSINISISGNYSVTVSDNNNCSNSDDILININPKPIINFGTISDVCDGDSIILNPGTFTSYLWSDTSTNQTLSVYNNGLYSVTITDSNNCTNDTTINIIFYNNPTLELGNNQSACEGQTVTLDAGFGTNYIYTWNTGATSQTINTLISGQFSVTVANANGCSKSDTVNVTINSNPNIDLGPNQQVCTGDNVNLDAGIGQSYIWSNSQSTQTINVATSGTYSVTVTLTGGCSGSGSVNINFTDLPTLYLVSDTTVCSGSNLNITATTNSTSYTWSNGSTNNNINISQSGTYSVTVTNSCGNNSSSVNATFNPNPVIPFGNDTTIQANNSLILDAGNAGSSYLWSTNETTQSIIINESGTYTLTVTSILGCISVDTIKVTVNPEPISGVHAYNMFTPNNDDVNEFWIIDNIDSFPNNSVEIYNRNGNMVYSANRYKNTWNGKYNYKDLPEGTYYYIIDLGNGSDVLKGHVTIVR